MADTSSAPQISTGGRPHGAPSPASSSALLLDDVDAPLTIPAPPARGGGLHGRAAAPRGAAAHFPLILPSPDAALAIHPHASEAILAHDDEDCVPALSLATPVVDAMGHLSVRTAVNRVQAAVANGHGVDRAVFRLLRTCSALATAKLRYLEERLAARAEDREEHQLIQMSATDARDAERVAALLRERYDVVYIARDVSAHASADEPPGLWSVFYGSLRADRSL